MLFWICAFVSLSSDPELKADRHYIQLSVLVFMVLWESNFMLDEDCWACFWPNDLWWPRLGKYVLHISDWGIVVALPTSLMIMIDCKNLMLSILTSATGQVLASACWAYGLVLYMYWVNYLSTCMYILIWKKKYNVCSFAFSKQAIHSEKTFDFLRSLVQNVPDHQTEEEMEGPGPSGSGIPEKKPKISRY